MTDTPEGLGPVCPQVTGAAHDLVLRMEGHNPWCTVRHAIAPEGNGGVRTHVAFGVNDLNVPAAAVPLDDVLARHRTGRCNVPEQIAFAVRGSHSNDIADDRVAGSRLQRRPVLAVEASNEGRLCLAAQPEFTARIKSIGQGMDWPAESGADGAPG